MTRVLDAAACGSLGGRGLPAVLMLPRKRHHETTKLGNPVGILGASIGDGTPRITARCSTQGSGTGIPFAAAHCRRSGWWHV